MCVRIICICLGVCTHNMYFLYTFRVFTVCVCFFIHKMYICVYPPRHICVHTPRHTHIYIFRVCTVCVCCFTRYVVSCIHHDAGWLRWVGSIKLQVSFAKEPYKTDDILQKRPVIFWIDPTDSSHPICIHPYVFIITHSMCVHYMCVHDQTRIVYMKHTSHTQGVSSHTMYT